MKFLKRIILIYHLEQKFNMYNELKKRLKNKRFTYKQVEELIHKAQQRAIDNILSDIHFGYKKKWIANKIKNRNYIGDDLVSFYFDNE